MNKHTVFDEDGGEVAVNNAGGDLDEEYVQNKKWYEEVGNHENVRELCG